MLVFPRHWVKPRRAAEGRRKAQKDANPGILEKVLAEKMTFIELAAWYADLNPVKKSASFERVKGALANFNKVLGTILSAALNPLGLEDYQNKREEVGRAPATINMEISIVKTMVVKAFNNSSSAPLKYD